MEDIRTEVLQKLEESLVGNEKKSECILIVEEAFVKLRKEIEKERGSKDVIKLELELLSKAFESKWNILHVNILKYWLFSELGISAIQWFKKSVKTYEEKKKSQSRIERVQIDGSRILSIVQNQLRAKVASRTFEGEEEHELFERSAKVLEDSIHIMISKTSISSQKIVSIDYDELTESMKEVEKISDIFLEYLKTLKLKQKEFIKEKLEFDFNKEKIRFLIDHSEHHNAREVEKKVGKSVKEFFEKSNITLEDVKQIVAEVNEIWQTFFYGEIGVYRKEFENMFADIEKRFEEWNIQKSLKKEENRKINEWKGPSVPVIKQSNNEEYTGTIRQTILDITKLGEEGEGSRPIMIGGWKCTGHNSVIIVFFVNNSAGWNFLEMVELIRTKTFIRMCSLVFQVLSLEFHATKHMQTTALPEEEEILFFLCCQIEENADWQCTARYDFRIMDRYRTKSCHSKRIMKHFNIENRSSVYRIPIKLLHKCRKDDGRDDTFHLEMDVVMLASSGVSRSEPLFKNPNYQQVFGTVTLTFSNISALNEKRSNFQSVNISGFPWIISIGKYRDHLKFYVECQFEYAHSLSCEAEAEIRLLKRSKSDEYYSKQEAEELHVKNIHITFIHFISFDELYNVDNDYIKNDSITIEAIITIFKPISS